MLMRDDTLPREAQQPRVTRHRWRAADATTGALIDVPGYRGRGVFIPREHLTAVIDALADIEDSD